VARLAQPAKVVQFTPPSSLEELVAFRADWLTRYQDAAYTERYRAAVAKVEAREVELEGAASKRAVAKALARSLFKVMAYKDEYEVARLHTQTGFLEGLDQQFEGDFRVEYHLAPPLLARKKPGSDIPAKMRFGPWMRSAFRLLSPLKVLRGTAFDVFGYTHERRAERRLRDDWLALADTLARELTLENRAAALKLAQLGESIRGYGHVKAANMARAAEETARLLQDLREPVKEIALVRMHR
jgi:indolepyruvate ferredoxin oxidoreductase